MATETRQRPNKLSSDIFSKFEKKKKKEDVHSQPEPTQAKTLEDVSPGETNRERPQRRQIRRTHSLFSESKGFWQDEEQKRKQALFGRVASVKAAEGTTDPVASTAATAATAAHANTSTTTPVQTTSEAQKPTSLASTVSHTDKRSSRGSGRRTPTDTPTSEAKKSTSLVSDVSFDKYSSKTDVENKSPTKTPIEALVRALSSTEQPGAERSTRRLRTSSRGVSPRSAGPSPEQTETSTDRSRRRMTPSRGVSPRSASAEASESTDSSTDKSEEKSSIRRKRTSSRGVSPRNEASTSSEVPESTDNNAEAATDGGRRLLQRRNWNEQKKAGGGSQSPENAALLQAMREKKAALEGKKAVLEEKKRQREIEEQQRKQKEEDEKKEKEEKRNEERRKAVQLLEGKQEEKRKEKEEIKRKADEAERIREAEEARKKKDDVERKRQETKPKMSGLALNMEAVASAERKEPDRHSPRMANLTPRSRASRARASSSSIHKSSNVSAITEQMELLRRNSTAVRKQEEARSRLLEVQKKAEEAQRLTMEAEEARRRAEEAARQFAEELQATGDHEVLPLLTELTSPRVVNPNPAMAALATTAVPVPAVTIPIATPETTTTIPTITQTEPKTAAPTTAIPTNTARITPTTSSSTPLRISPKDAKQKATKEELRRLEEEEEKRNQLRAAKMAEWQATVQAVLEPPDEDEEDDLDPSVVLENIKENKVEIVNLALWGLEDDTVSDILEALADNTSTATLFLDGNELEAKSFLRINDMLQRNKTLKHLSVNYVMLGDLGARTVSEGFAKNNTVKALSASGNDLEESGMEGLVEGLKHNSTITTLILKENTISDSGCEVLQKFMSANKNITYLDISNNYIGQEGAAHLATMLLTNNSLLHLNLSRNSLEDAGCVTVAHALAKSPAIESIDMGDNIIGTMGILELAAALKQNRSLKRLDLRGRENLFAIQAEIALQDALLSRTDGLEILWKREGTTPTKPKITEVQSVVDYFGDERILKIYEHGKTLQPLMDIEETLPHLHYTENIAQHLWRIVFPSGELMDSRQQNQRLDMFTKILKFQLDNKHGGMEYQLSLLTINHLSMLSQMMDPEKSPSTRVGFTRLQLLRIFIQICRMEVFVQSDHATEVVLNENLVGQITKVPFLSHSVELFFKYPNNNIFHCEFVALVLQLLYNSPLIILEELLINLRFLERMMDAYKDQWTRPASQHAGAFAHITKIAVALVEAAQQTPELKILFFSVPGFEEFATSTNGPVQTIYNAEFISEADKPQRDPNASPFTSLKADEIADEDEEKDQEDDEMD